MSMRVCHEPSAKHVLAAMAILASVILATPAGAATGDCFLRVDGVAGDSADARHRGEIEVVSWSLAMASSGSMISSGAGGAGTGRVDFQPLKVTQRVDRAVPFLAQLTAMGQHVPSAVLTCRRPGREAADYFRVTLAEVLISGVRLSDAADTPPTAEVTLAYGRITIEYRPQMPDGSLGPPVVTGWDVKANRRQ
jgi:type VI secretion system secreted protein Hcp